MMIRPAVAILIATMAVATSACSSTGSTATVSPATAPASASAAPAASPAATARPSTPASPPALRVTGLEVKADPADHIGACPIEIAFSAHISVAGSGTVSYKWISSDGDASEVKTLTFPGTGSQDVTSTWTVNRDTVPTHAGWSSIDIISPASAAANSSPSAQAAFVFTCDADDDVEAIGFGIGGSDADCSIAKNARTFAPTDPVRMVANWWPSLASGTIVTIRLTRNGELVDGYPVTTNLHESTKCVHGPVSQGFLPVGHYRMDVMPDTARAIGAEFDVK